jgi:hypothetical protein
LLSAKKCADSMINYPKPVCGPNYSYLSILSCLCCPVCAVLSILSCLFCPVCFFLAVSIFMLSLGRLFLLSYLDSHSVSVLTICNDCPQGPVLFFLSLFCSLSCPAFPVYIVLPWIFLFITISSVLLRYSVRNII